MTRSDTGYIMDLPDKVKSKRITDFVAWLTLSLLGFVAIITLIQLRGQAGGVNCAFVCFFFLVLGLSHPIW